MEEEDPDPPGSSRPPPYTVSQHPSKSPLPQPRPSDAFATGNHYSYPPGGFYGPPGFQTPSAGGFSYHGYGYLATHGPSQPYPPGYSPGQQPYYPQHLLPPRQHQQQQQQTVLVIGGQESTPQHVPVAQSFVGQMFLAVFVCLCCGFLFGIAALVLAILASNHSHSQPETAKTFGRASIWVSSAGIAVGAAIIIIAVIVSVSTMNSSRYD